MALDAAGRVVEPESKTLEYKQDLSSPDKVMESIVAFANSAGGKLIVGVADDGMVVGVTNPLLEEERLANLISDTVRPQLLPTIELVPVGGVTVLVAEVYLGAQRPYYLTRLGRQRGVYIRVGSSDRLAGPGMVAELARDSQGIAFDRLPAPGAKLADLDRAMLTDLLKHDMSDQALQTLSLITEDQGQLVPTNAGVLIGAQHPEMYHPHAWVQCARFRGDSKRNITDQARIYGPLPRAVDATMDFLKHNAFLRAEFGEIQRQDAYSIPITPLRELVVNALVHSSYADHGTPIKIAFYDESIVIESPGGLVPGLTVEKILSGTSVIRNPTLARVFAELGYIEQWGTGLPKAMEAVLAAGLPPFEIVEGHERLVITIHIENHDPAKHKDSHKDHQDSHKDDNPLGTRGGTILAALASGPLSRTALFSSIGLHNDHRTFTRHIAPLIEAGLVTMTDPDRPTMRDQRYRLTDAGRAILADQRR
ncbi:MAG: helix-turn-helix domain-containing protein [Propionibacteriaceae bacterium]|nr:helix-turn-helix domain-containing protein [Propionibacteriaceae bacterium]